MRRGVVCDVQQRRALAVCSCWKRRTVLASNCLAPGLHKATWHPTPTRTTELADGRRRRSRCAEPAAAPGRTRHLAAQHAAQQAAQRVENRVLGRAAELARPQGRKPRDRCQGLRLLRAPAGERRGRHLCGVPSCASQHRRSGDGPPWALGSQDGRCHAAAEGARSCQQDAGPGPVVAGRPSASGSKLSAPQELGTRPAASQRRSVCLLTAPGRPAACRTAHGPTSAAPSSFASSAGTKLFCVNNGAIGPCDVRSVFWRRPASLSWASL